MFVDGLSATLRALSFLTMFQAGGLAIFLTFHAPYLKNTEPGLRRVGLSCTLFAIVFVLAQYLLEAARLSGELTGMLNAGDQDTVFRSTTSVTLAFRLVGLALIFIGLRIRVRPMGVSGAVLLAISFLFVGHTATHPARLLLAPTLVVHILVVTYWFGALLPLRRISLREPNDIGAKVVEDFSARAVWVVPLLLVAGLVLAVALLPDLNALSNTTYGNLLLLKMGGFALLMLFASLNRWRYTATIERGDKRGISAFRASVLAEVLIIAAVLCATVLLTTFYSPTD